MGLLLLLAFPAQAQQKWTLVPNHMIDSRWAPAACLLADRKEALIVGGYSYPRKRCVASANLFDETSGKFVPCRGRLTYPRDFAQANLLPDGTVLISGGYNDVIASLDIAEIYDPKTDQFRLAKARMVYARELFQATTLSDGRVLLTGGLDLWIRRTTETAEVYDPSTGEFQQTAGSMADDRFGHTACLLADGRVLVVGGTSWTIGKASRVLASAEIYDPKTACFTRTKGSMLAARDRPTATLLPGGKVLIAGGQGQNGTALDFSELFDPATGEFTRIESSQGIPRMAHSATELPNGDVVLAGGWSAPAKATTPSAMLFDPSAQTFASLPDLPFA
ncbi:MAG TPA: kelch repeat-containing protein, partial [Capsulimonadaceae bacterium]|nr:kelch repeat-containing protein [Capsulimonadaceae bacterium]